MNTKKLKRCPFCNGSAEICEDVVSENGSRSVYRCWIACGDCLARTATMSGPKCKDAAFHAWNRRVGICDDY